MHWQLATKPKAQHARAFVDAFAERADSFPESHFHVYYSGGSSGICRPNHSILGDLIEAGRLRHFVGRNRGFRV
jgi:hypothetical protein